MGYNIGSYGGVGETRFDRISVGTSTEKWRFTTNIFRYFPSSDGVEDDVYDKVVSKVKYSAFTERIGLDSTYYFLGGFLDTYRVTGSDGGMVLGARSWNGNTAEGIHIRYNGNVGIGGVSQPGSKLHVNGGARIYGAESSGNNPASDAYFVPSGVFSDPPQASTSLYCENWVRSPGYIALSDSRIKNNIVDVDDSSALETLRLLQPKYYNYVDTRARGSHRVIGFLAGQVKQVCPDAVSIHTDYIPNIYELANVSDSNVITFTNFNTSDLESNASVIKTIGIGDKEHRVNIAEVVDEHTIRVEEDLSEWTGSADETGNVVAGNQLFVYGQEVDDFHNLNKDALFSVATASIQEIDRQLQAEKAKVASLEARISALENN